MGNRHYIQERLTDILHNPDMAQAIARALCDEGGAGYVNVPEGIVGGIGAAALREQAKSAEKAASEGYSARLAGSPTPQPSSDGAEGIPSLRSLDTFIDLLLSGSKTTHGAIIYGCAGIGKSHRVQAALAARGRGFVLFNSYSTPLSLYEILWLHRKETVVLDDVNTLLKDPKAVAILKAALYSVAGAGARMITYSTTSKVLEERGIPARFIFEGRIILILNEIPRTIRETFQALLSRVYSCEVRPTLDEKKALVRRVLSDAPDGFMDFLCSRAEFSNEHRFNVRTALQCAEIWRALPRERAEEMIDEVLDTEPRFRQFALLERHQELPVARRVEIFTAATGYGRATYFDIKRRFYLAQYGRKAALRLDADDMEEAIVRLGGI
jgi:hypothetical protein